MQRLALRAAASLVIATLLGAPASAQTFGYTGSIVTWTAPTSGMYYIDAIGAQGGAGSGAFVGGRGAEIGGQFSFTAGDMFQLAVGGAGVSSLGNGGGGGGSFFMDFFGNALLIAGGGGGIRTGANQNGCDASVTEYGTIGSGGSPISTCAQKLGDLGQGGIVSSSSWGSAGAGLYSNGADDSPFGTGGKSWANGLAGGTDAIGCGSSPAPGGFGGGGAGNGCYGGGGGGGYSGGDGGLIGGGAGSYNTGSARLAVAGVGFGNGNIRITALDVTTTPEPASLVLMATGLLGAFGVARRRRSTSSAN